MRRRKRDGVIAASVADGGSRASQSEHGSRRETPQVARVYRSVRRNDDHARSLARIEFAVQIVTTQFAANRGAANRENSAEVRLNQNADRVASEFRGNLARGGA